MGTLLAGVHARSSMKGNLTDPRDRSFEGEVLRMVSTDTLTIRFKTEVAQFAAEYAKQATADSNTTSLAQVSAGESGPGGLTREVETPLPSNSPHDHMILRVDLVGSHGWWKRPCLRTTPR